MNQKFVPLDAAAEQLNVSKEHLNALREQGTLRAYKDGASWKFRAEDIERFALDGVPSLDSLDSGINLGDELDLGELTLDTPSHVGLGASPVLTADDEDDALLTLGDEIDDLEIEPQASNLHAPDPSGLDLTLASDEPSDTTDTEAAAASLDDIDLDIPDDDDADSILLSEPELGNSDRPPSTIIGKAELGLLLDDQSDLKLGGDAGASDVRLAPNEDDLILAPAGSATNFDDIDELELDLEAESSRVLAPEDLVAAQKAAQAQQKAPATSDLKLDDDLDLVGSDTGLAGLSELSLEGSGASKIDPAAASGKQEIGLSGLSALELEDDDEFVLGDGSDITLSSADSGINLKPSDSGLSLDDPSLSGAALGSSLDLGSALGADSFKLGGSDPALGEEGFQLSPVSESELPEDEEDSSQVIALDAFEEAQEAEDLIGAGAVGMAPAGAAFASGYAPQADTQFGGGVVFFLSTCILLLGLCGIMIFDLVRNMWSWGEPYSLNSSLIDGLTGLFF